MIPYVKEKEGTVADWLLGAIAVNFQTASAADAKYESLHLTQHFDINQELQKEQIGSYQLFMLEPEMALCTVKMIWLKAYDLLTESCLL